MISFEIGCSVRQVRESFGATADRDHVPAVELHHGACRFANVIVVVDDQETSGHEDTLDAPMATFQCANLRVRIDHGVRLSRPVL